MARCSKRFTALNRSYHPQSLRRRRLTSSPHFDPEAHPRVLKPHNRRLKIIEKLRLNAWGEVLQFPLSLYNPGNLF
jgi:hypothetical protein